MKSERRNQRAEAVTGEGKRGDDKERVRQCEDRLKE